MEEENKIELFDPAPATLERRHPELLSPYQVVEAEEGPDLRAYWRIIRKRHWTILSILLAVFTVVLIATLKQKPVYRAKALLEIAKENPNILTVQELFQLENVSDNYLETQYKVLQSETLARRVIDELHLDQVKEFNPGPAQAFPPDAQTEQAVLRRFEDRLSVEPLPRSRLVRVSFDSEDPQLAAKAVNALATNYIQENLETRWEATQKASEWLSQQLQSLKARLEKSEDELQHYAQANGLLFLESEKGQTENIVDERLRQLQDELTKAQADRYEKESLYRLVEAGDYGSLPGVFDNKLMQDLTVRLADLERQKAELTPIFSDTYPKVKEIQSQIDRIQQLLTQERKRAAERITNDYKAAVRRENLIGQAFEEQRKQANLVAGRSVQYNILKREVDTNKQLYEGLLQRLKEAGVSAGLKATNIRVVDSAAPPEFESYRVGSFFRNALQALGHEHALIDEMKYLNWLGHSLLRKAMYRALRRRPLTYWKYNRDLVRAAWQFKPEVMLVTKGSYISPITLAQIKEDTGASLVNYATDDPFNPVSSTHDLRSGIRFYDVYACTKRAIMPDVKRAGCPHVCFVPFGYEPSIHFPDSPASQEEGARYKSDVAFIGGADADRFPYFRTLVESLPTLRLDLYGDYWNRYPCLRRYHRGKATGRRFRLALRGATISPGLVRRANRDGHSMRTFEIPACGGFGLFERTDEHMELFKEGKHAAFFGSAEELVDKVHYYLKHDDERARMTEAAHRKVTGGRNTYKDRLEHILEISISLR